MEAQHSRAGIGGSPGLRWATLALASCWALTGALLGVWVLRYWWTTPVPDPVFTNFFGPGTVLVVGFQAVLMTVPLGGLWAALTVTGFRYIRRTKVTPGRRRGWAWP
ncbi:MAG TPA: hypothetical protein VMA72_06715 [Streptosporangiaceae bacterium]|nr:hypothetical protein [Streptosporangiaceae bacterium]